MKLDQPNAAAIAKDPFEDSKMSGIAFTGELCMDGDVAALIVPLTLDCYQHCHDKVREALDGFNCPDLIATLALNALGICVRAERAEEKRVA